MRYAFSNNPSMGRDVLFLFLSFDRERERIIFLPLTKTKTERERERENLISFCLFFLLKKRESFLFVSPCQNKEKGRIKWIIFYFPVSCLVLSSVFLFEKETLWRKALPFANCNEQFRPITTAFTVVADLITAKTPTGFDHSQKADTTWKRAMQSWPFD